MSRTFGRSETVGTVGTFPVSVAVGDFNGDNHADFAAANFNTNNVSIRLKADTSIPVMAFPTCRIRATFAGPPKQIVVGTFDLYSGIRSIAVTWSR